ncbi:MAG: bifunctional glutamate N-acetyltransferase/amino-acid acetyltransferase ArgJ [Planctomycetes bacterium]|nr:bifunctional glutamate N-acetyltransferase/amino-acid acetyltransferase ArgJ [Planctomycetota bacterium]
MSQELPRGFEYAGVRCGIKRTGKDDFAMIAARHGAVAAGVYTQNLVFAAPVEWDRRYTPSADVRVVAVNSGNANACTGQRGLDDAHSMARLAADTIGARAEQCLVMSTGIIGEFLPMDRIAEGTRLAAARLGSEQQHFLAAAQAIMTTDSFPKYVQRSFTVGEQEIAVAGMAKGAGMIGPRMATMLAVITTDARLTPAAAQDALTAAVELSFNCISVEGHMSTNDTVLLLASGNAGGEPMTGRRLAEFTECLADTCAQLAKMIPNDGEGATHLIEIEVRGTASNEDARRIAKTIAESALVKTAICGADPNWGRIVSAAGYAGPKFDPQQVDLLLNGFRLYERGAPLRFDAAAVSEAIKSQRDTRIELQVGDGTGHCRFWTSDLTHEYIRINADYHT